MRARLLWAVIACVGAAGLLAATKPTDSQATQAISKTVKGRRVDTSSALYPASALAGVGFRGMGVTVVTVDSVEITRWGNYSEKDAYWPVEACVTVMARGESFGGPPPPPKRVSALMRFRVKGDDFEDWAATEIPIAGNQSMGSFVCQPKNPVAAADRSPTVTPAAVPELDPRTTEEMWAKPLRKYSDAKAAYVVRHAHGGVGFLTTGDNWPYCEGVLYIIGQRVVFEPSSATDGNQHAFANDRSAIAEAKENRIGMGSYAAFHIRFKDASNFNLVPMTQSVANVIRELSFP